MAKKGAIGFQCTKPLESEEYVNMVLEAIYPTCRGGSRQQTRESRASGVGSKLKADVRHIGEKSKDAPEGHYDTSDSDGSPNNSPKSGQRNANTATKAPSSPTKAANQPSSPTRTAKPSSPVRTAKPSSPTRASTQQPMSPSPTSGSNQAQSPVRASTHEAISPSRASVAKGPPTRGNSPKRQTVVDDKRGRRASPEEAENDTKGDAKPNAAAIAKMESIMALQRMKRARVRQFYLKCMARFGSISHTLECLLDTDMHGGSFYDENSKISGREWNTLLAKAKLCSYREARDLFDLMNEDKDSVLTIEELHRGLEGASAIKRAEDLRRRMLLQHSTTMNATRAMEPNLAHWDRRLTLEEIGPALAKVGVTEMKECRLLFKAVDVLQLGKISIGEVMCCLAAVSPFLLLEELRERLVKRCGSVEEAWRVMSQNESMDEEEFRQRGPEIGLNAMETAKAFRHITGEAKIMKKTEFIGAIEMSTPSISWEHFRQKMRYNFGAVERCISEALEGLEGLDNVEADGTICQNELRLALEPIKLTPAEFHKFYALIAFENEEDLSIPELERRMRLLVPTYALQYLGALLLSDEYLSKAQNMSHAQLYDLINFEQFVEKCRTQMGQQVAPPLILRTAFDIMDVNHDGVVTWSQTLCGLSSSMTSTRAQVPAAQRERKVKLQLKRDMEAAFKVCGDVKTQMRLGLVDETPASSVKAAVVAAPPAPPKEVVATALEGVCQKLAEQQSVSSKSIVNYAQQLGKVLETHGVLLETDFRYQTKTTKER